MIYRILALAWKELLQLRRDRPTIMSMIIVPVMQLLLFGYAIDTDVRHMRTVVFDADMSAASRDLGRSMEATGFYDIVGHVSSFEEVDHAMRAGQARIALVVPAGYGRAIAEGRSGHVELVIDGSDPQIVANATNTAAALVASRSADLQVVRLARRGIHVSTEPPLTMEPSTWYNPELRTAVYVVPGLIGVILTMTMIMLTGLAMARERERGTLEQLIVSPLGKLELVLGKVFPYVIVGYVQITLVLTAAHLVFHVPIVGSVGLLYLLSAMFIAANLTIGLLFSTVAQTQQQAVQAAFVFLLPNLLITGFIFPFEGMPKAVRWLAEGLPLTHFLRIVRGIVLKGSDFQDVRIEFLWLTGIFFTVVVLSTARVKKKLV